MSRSNSVVDAPPPAIFQEFFGKDYGKTVRDCTTTISIDVTIDGETETITMSLDDMASVLQPALRETFGPLGKFRRIPKTVLPKVELVTPTKYLHEGNCGAIARLLPIVSSEKKTLVSSLVEKVSPAKQDMLASALVQYCGRDGSVAQLMGIALEGEFSKFREEKGSIMRGSTFAVQVMKLFTNVPQLAQYRTRILLPVMREISTAASEPDIVSTFRSVIGAITSDEALRTMPTELRYVCSCLAYEAERIGLSEEERDGQVSGFVMLRFFNPAIISPWTYGVLEGTSQSPHAMNHLKTLTRVLQKFSTGLSFSEDSMASIQAAMTELYPKFRQYLKHISSSEWRNAETQISEEDAITPELETCQLMFDALCSCPDFVKQQGWNDVLFLVQEMRFVYKMQLFLQTEASYLSVLEKIEDNLRRIASNTVSNGDPFEIVYLALKVLSSWHSSLFYMLHDRIEMEWKHVNSVADWLHRIVLEVEDVYEPFSQCFLYVFRMLIDISRDLQSNSADPAQAELNETVVRLLPILGRPLKRFGELLAVMSDARLPEEHPDSHQLDLFMNAGKATFNSMRELVNVSAALEMGQLELQFVDKIELVRAGRVILYQGVVHDPQQNAMELWLFNDLLLCGAMQGASKQYKVVFKVPVTGLLTKPVPGDDCSFIVCIPPDDMEQQQQQQQQQQQLQHEPSAEDVLVMGGASMAVRAKRMSRALPQSTFKELRLVCSSAKQKATWLQKLLGQQDSLKSSVRMSRSSAAQEQLPGLTSRDWEILMAEGVRSKFQDGQVIVKDGQVNLKLYRVQEGKVMLRKGNVELLKLGPGDVFGINALLGAEHETLSYEVAVVDGPAAVESVSVSVVQLLVGKDNNLRRRLFKSVVVLEEVLLRKVRMRLAAARVLVAKQRVQVPASEALDWVLKALDEVESKSKSAYGKLDVADILLGAEPATFTTPSITSVLPDLLEMKCFGLAQGSRYTRAHWHSVLSVMEQEKAVSCKDGCPTLTKKGRTMLVGPRDTQLLKLVEDVLAANEMATMEHLFGLKNESLLVDFPITAKQADRLFVSDHYLCLSGRVLGLGEKKRVINIGLVQQADLKKKVLEVQLSGGEGLKITFKSPNEAVTVHSIIQRHLDERGGTAVMVSPRSMAIKRSPRRGSVTLRNTDKTSGIAIAGMLESCPVRKFEPGIPIAGNKDTPCLYVLQGPVSMVRLVAKMAAGDVLIHTLDEGTIFAPDSTFFGLPDEAKIAWVSDEVTEAREISSSFLTDSTESCVSILRWLAQKQAQELALHLQNL